MLPGAAKDCNAAGIREVVGTALLTDSVKSECVAINLVGIARRHTQLFFNGISGAWEEKIVSEDDYLDEMRKLDTEQEVLDAELQVINRIIEQYLNDPKTWESRD